ncbi:hypothetical protein AgCh_031112 [Apium graveolens]
MPFDSFGSAKLKISQERLEPSFEEVPTLGLKPLPDYLIFAFLGAPPNKRLEYIYDNLKGDRPVPPVLTEGPSRAPQIVDRFSLGDAHYRRSPQSRKTMYGADTFLVPEGSQVVENLVSFAWAVESPNSDKQNSRYGQKKNQQKNPETKRGRPQNQCGRPRLSAKNQRARADLSAATPPFLPQNPDFSRI